MRTLYIDCFSGASGNMLIGMLLDLGLPFDALKADIDALGLAGHSLIFERVKRRGIEATHFDVETDGKEPLRTLKGVIPIIENSGLPDSVAARSIKAFQRLAEVEARAHGVDIEKVHFHEIGAVDTIIDVVGWFAGLERLGIEQILASPVNVGSGTVTFSHGTFPVPAPATAELLKGVPIFSKFEGELTTPTGALLTTESATRFGEAPAMSLEKQGWGAGNDKPHPNVLRGLLGEAEPVVDGLDKCAICQIEANIDDMNPEVFSFVIGKLMEAGALDASVAPIQMKKNRPGGLLTVLCLPEDLQKLSDIVFSETTTLGVRISRPDRIALERKSVTVETPHGEVSVKLAIHKGKVRSAAPEYESCRELADKTGISLMKIMEAAKEAAGSLE